MKKILALSIIILLGACSYAPEWMGLSEKEKILEGTRVKVITETSNITVDESLNSTAINLPEPELNATFIEGSPTPENILFNGSVKEKQSVSLAAPREDGYLILATPVVANNKIFVLDGEGVISARLVDDISKEAWRYKIKNDEDDEFISGGLTFLQDNIIATTHEGNILSINAETGKLNWQRRMVLPLRSSPVGAEGNIYVINVNNELYAISAQNGAILWTNSGISEPAGLLGSASPAVKSGVVITAYSSGEIYGLRADNGRALWGDSLESGSKRKAETFFAITDIDATPVISGDMVFVGTNQSVFTARDALSGRLIWEQNAGITKTPWVAGDYIYMLTTKDEVIAFYKNDGRARWITKLRSYENEEEKKNKITWSPPILANGTLFLASSHGSLISISPENGQIGQNFDIPKHQILRPVFAAGKLFLMNNNGRLTVLE